MPIMGRERNILLAKIGGFAIGVAALTAWLIPPTTPHAAAPFPLGAVANGKPGGSYAAAEAAAPSAPATMPAMNDYPAVAGDQPASSPARRDISGRSAQQPAYASRSADAMNRTADAVDNGRADDAGQQDRSDDDAVEPRQADAADPPPPRYAQDNRDYDRRRGAWQAMMRDYARRGDDGDTRDERDEERDSE